MLYQDIIADIQTDTIYASTFSGTDISALKPAFSFEGKTITVNGTAQITNESAQNFSKLVSYIITAEDGTTKKFIVKFTDTHLPAVYISTNNIPVDSKENYVDGYINIKANITGDSLYGGMMQIKGRAAHEPKQWINRLMQDKAFRSAVRKRWNEVKNDKVNTITQYIAQLSGLIALSQAKNFLKWDILNQKVYLNLQVAGSFEGEVNYLKTFLQNSIAWLDSQFNGSRFN